MKKSLEYKDQKSQKFWQIEVIENTHSVTFGKIGSSGKNIIKPFPTAAAALKDAKKLIQSKLKNGYQVVESEKTTKQNIANLPEPLQEFYKKYDRLGADTIVSSAELAGLKIEFNGWTHSHLEEDEGEVDEGNIHLLTLSKTDQLVPFGKNASGDFFFLDPFFKNNDEMPVLKFHHDEAMTCSIQASSLAAFVKIQIQEGDTIFDIDAKTLKNPDEELYNIADSLYIHSKYKQALSKIEEALAIAFKESYVELKIMCLNVLNKDMELKKYVDEISSKFPKNVLIWLLYARSCANLQLWDEAVKGYKISLENDPHLLRFNDETSYHWLGYILLFKLNKAKEAQPYLEKAMELFNKKAMESDNPNVKGESLFWSSAILCALKRIPESIQILSQAIKFDKSLKNEAKTSDDFETIHGLPEFKKLVG